MNFLIAAWYEFLKNIRDVKMIALVIIFPLVTTYLLGSAGKGFFKADDGSAIQAAYVNLDNGAVGQAFDEFLNNKDVAARLKTTRYSSLEQGKKAISDGPATALIYVPQGLTSGIMNGGSEKIQLYGGQSLELVETLVDGFASSFNANLAVMKTGGKPVQAERTSAVTRVSGTRNGEYPDLTDYYAVLLLLQALVIGSIFGVYITTRNYDSDIHIRIHALPVNPWTLLAGRITGSAAYLLMASAATILFTAYVYGVNWSGNLPVLVGTLVLFCLIMVGIGVLCGKLFRKTSTAIMMVFVLMFLFGSLSGATSPRSGIDILGFITPNYYAKVLLFGSIYGYSSQVMVTQALCLLGIAAAVFAAIAALMRRVRYDNL